MFRNGRSQAVRLPKEFRFEGSEVKIRREGEAVILEPLERPGWPEGFFEAIRVEDDDFARPEQPSSPEVEVIDGEAE